MAQAANGKKSHAEYCSILGVPENASYKEIRDIYTGLAKLYSGGINGKAEASKKKLQEINDAWEYFKMEERRRNSHTNPVLDVDSLSTTIQKSTDQTTRNTTSNNPNRQNGSGPDDRTESSGCHKTLVSRQAVKWSSIAVSFFLAASALTLYLHKDREADRIDMHAKQTQTKQIKKEHASSLSLLKSLMLEKAKTLNLDELQKGAQKFESSPYKTDPENTVFTGMSGETPFYENTAQKITVPILISPENKGVNDKKYAEVPITVRHCISIKAATLTPEDKDLLTHNGMKTPDTDGAFIIRGSSIMPKLYDATNIDKVPLPSSNTEQMDVSRKDFNSRSNELSNVEFLVIISSGQKYIVDDNRKVTRMDYAPKENLSAPQKGMKSVRTNGQTGAHL